MASQSSKLFKVVALSLVICIMQIYVVANPAVSAKSATTNMALGKLIVSGNQTILVNGNTATTGTTIFSGSQLQTPAGVTGSVQLGESGRLSIEPNTNLTVTFDNANVDVKVAKGNAFLLTNAGVAGAVTSPDGTTTSTTNSSPVPQTGRGRRNGAIAGGIGLIVIIILAIWLSNDDDDSP